METLPQNEYEEIKVTGIPSVQFVEPTEYHKHSFVLTKVILILGSTGAGKSTFIEAFASNTSLGISSNRLEGFTQTISAYQLINVQRVTGTSIYLIDIPGFSDTKISETKILSMLKDWMQKSGLGYFDHILYFMPINSTRLPGSQREVLRTFQALTGIDTARGITVVTTMWDLLGSDTAKQRGERNFNQLQDKMWKAKYIGEGAQILKFHNTQESALSILDHALQRLSMPYFNIQPLMGPLVHIRETSFALNIYSSLQTGLQNIHLELTNIESDLVEAQERGDDQVTEILVPRQQEAQRLLVMFEQELQDFGEPPEPKPVKDQPHTSSTEDAPASVITTSSTNGLRVLMLKGLLRRLIQAAKRRGKQWFRKPEDEH